MYIYIYVYMYIYICFKSFNKNINCQIVNYSTYEKMPIIVCCKFMIYKKLDFFQSLFKC